MFWINRYGIDWKNDINRDRVLKLLQYYENKKVNAWKLSFDAKVLHYTQAIMELKRKGYNIQNKRERKGRIVHSYYKLITE